MLSASESNSKPPRKLQELTVKNIGPIKDGVVRQNKINVFFGPNNSGKSIVSRLIHTINSTPTPSLRSAKLQLKRYGYPTVQPKAADVENAYIDSILQNAGLPHPDAITHGQNKGHIEIKFRAKTLSRTLHRKRRLPNKKLALLSVLYFRHVARNTRTSIYIPAGRTGTMQFFTSIMRVRNRLLGDLLGMSGEDRPMKATKPSTKSIQSFTRLHGISEYLEQFYDIILSSHADGLAQDTQALFSGIFPGSIDTVKTPSGLAQITYEDPVGFVTDLESAGSGTVATFPIAAGMNHVNDGGTLIIEEPEAHLEPSKQIKMIEWVQNAACAKNANLIFTTHSDYVVKKLLALVWKKKIRRTDLGLYYFDRADSGLTTIRRINADESGEAEQPLFQDALDTLIGEFSA